MSAIPLERIPKSLPFVAVPAVLVGILAFAVPLLPQGGDTVPGRLGMASLACSGNTDLSRIEWLRTRGLAGRVPYWALPSSDHRKLVSVFGPGPAYLGAALFTAPAPGTTVTDTALRHRARRGAAFAISLSTLFLSTALLARVSVRWAVLGGLAAACSFAGLATLGQGLWQQTAALPCLMAALAAAAWADRQPWLLLPASALAVLAATLRLPDGLLAVSVLGFGIVMARRANAGPLVLLFAGIAGILAAMPVLVWNLWYFDSVLPAAQHDANARFVESVIVLSPSHLATSLPGLLVSPARGVLWFAPVFLLGCWAWSRRCLPLTLGIVAQLLLAAAFYKWWGGLSYGPRLLSLSLWIAVFVAVSSLHHRRAVLGAALAITVAVGLYGAVRYDPRRWEIPNDPDSRPGVLWKVIDSPLVAMLSTPVDLVEFGDAPEGPFVFCAARGDGRPFTLADP